MINESNGSNPSVDFVGCSVIVGFLGEMVGGDGEGRGGGTGFGSWMLVVGRLGFGFTGPGGIEGDDEPKTLPWPLNLPEDEEEDDDKELLNFFIKPFILSFISPILSDTQMEKQLI